ncbi:uncharacterized protein BX663DRAFT_525087 [Cokeromyces recurvatus]|uniref:uncharacterized protein n=1 Tax=Cokeromyces recurvatus TaxID=90255 RepID=UPI00221F7182|nr:uncharacterized protein BX663DRAFT_525087 [Cokeromyces recurvatus]KAI7898370.1 hypothetical protein BX663DRAFT_525087 [Cokeromyces recurvatus]
MYIGESLTHYVPMQMMITAAMASACSTGALSFLLSPYVNSIYVHTALNDENPRITSNTVISIETLDLLARSRTTTLQLRELLPIPNSSLMTWKVNKKVLEKQYHLIDQGKNVSPRIHQHRFWLDQRNGVGNRDIMSSILRIVHEQGRQKSL